jgi:hypothetical protein
MGQNKAGKTIVLANIGGGKSLLGGGVILALALIPSLPGFGHGLTYSAFFYTTSLGVALRLASSAVLLLIGLSLLYGASLVFSGSARGVWLDGGDIKWGRVGTKRLATSRLKSATFDPRRQGVVLELRDTERTMIIPTMGLRSSDAPEPLVSKLRELII